MVIDKKGMFFTVFNRPPPLFFDDLYIKKSINDAVRMFEND